ncbi:MAG TPA: hypothetical protein VG497_05745 [Kribbella sp.]|nr:hypothetical protein [Kribbella sp.]
MTEPTPEPEAPEPEAVPEPAPAGDPQDLGDAGKKALAEERKLRRAEEKSRKDLEARLKEYEDRDKSDLEKALELSKTAEQERDAAKAEALRLRTAIKHGISDEDAELFLTGTDEETLTRQAERLAERIAAAGPRVPKPDPLQGARGPVGMDARIAEAEKNGDVKASIALKSQALLKK